MNLGLYDYGARMYDAAIGRFSTSDPLSEYYSEQSVFVYGANNPVKYIDYNGEGPVDPRTGKRKSTNLISINNFHPILIGSQSNSAKAYDAQLFNSAKITEIINAGDQARGRDFSDIYTKKGPQYSPLEKNYFSEEGYDISYSISNPRESTNLLTKKDAAVKGNYLYVEELGKNSFEVGTVKDGMISKIEKFKKNEEGIFSMTSSSTYQVSKGKVQTEKNLFGKTSKFRQVETSELFIDYENNSISVKNYTYKEYLK